MGEDTDIIRKESRINWRIWFHGLSAAFIGGFATAGSTGAAAMMVGEGFKKSAEIALVSWTVAGATTAFGYLKKSPVPELPKALETLTTTATLTVKTESTSEQPKP